MAVYRRENQPAGTQRYHRPGTGSISSHSPNGARTIRRPEGQHSRNSGKMPSPTRKGPGGKKAWIFLGTPVLFCVLTLGALFAIGAPTVSPYIGLAKYFFNSQQEQTDSTNLYEQLKSDLEGLTSIPLSQLIYPNKGDQYGRITVENTTVDAPLYYGDSTKELNRGVATYADSKGAGIPGESMTVLLAGHNNTFFNGLQDVKEGDIVHVDTHYGRYEYRITEMKVADYNDETTYDFSRTDENLIMYTCYPFDALGFTPQRYFVYAEYVSGPMIDKES